MRQCLCIIIPIILFIIFVIGICLLVRKIETVRMTGSSFIHKFSAPEYDEEFFQAQLKHLNSYKRNKKFENIKDSTIVIGDAHDSLDSIFVPLINAGLIEPGSVGFVYDSTIKGKKFIYEPTGNPNNNKVVYCGDIIARGANLYDIELLNCVLDMAIDSDDIILVFGNHDIYFMLDQRDDNLFIHKDINDDYKLMVRNKMKNYFKTHIEALAYIFDIKDKSFIVSHTFLNSKHFVYIPKPPNIYRPMYDRYKACIEAICNIIGNDNNIGISMDSFDEFVKTAKIDNKDISITRDIFDNRVTGSREYKLKVLTEYLDYLRKENRKEKFVLDDSKYKQKINECIKRYVVNGRLPPGSATPTGSERPLCVDLNSYVTLNKIDLNELHNLLCNVMDNSKYIDYDRFNVFEKIFYSSRPSESHDKTYLYISGYPVSYNTTNDKINWFVGHTQVQAYEDEKRKVEDNNITYYFMDTNTMNYFGDEDTIKAAGITEDRYKRAFEYLFYGVIHDGGEIECFSETILNDDVADFIVNTKLSKNVQEQSPFSSSNPSPFSSSNPSPFGSKTSPFNKKPPSEEAIRFLHESAKAKKEAEERAIKNYRISPSLLIKPPNQ